MKPVISICHCTRRLPNGWHDAFLEWKMRADEPERVEYILTPDIDKVDQLCLMSTDFEGWHSVTVAPNRGRCSAAIAWNAAGEASRGQFLITVSDDFECPDHWDSLLLACVPDLDKEAMIDVDCGENSFPLLPFSLITRAYYDRLRRDYGYTGFFHPDYYGFYADCEVSELARRDRVVVNARHLLFRHNAPAMGTPEWKADGVYQWQQRPEAVDTGKRVYARRVMELGIQGIFMPSGGITNAVDSIIGT